MLKQQLQKTEEEFYKEFPQLLVHVKAKWSEPDEDGYRTAIPQYAREEQWRVKNFIHQAQIKAVKAFAEEIQLEKKDVNNVHDFDWATEDRISSAKDFAGGEVFGYNRAVEDIKQKQQQVINNLLKDI